MPTTWLIWITFDQRGWTGQPLQASRNISSMLLHKLPNELGRNVISVTCTSRPQYALHWEITLILLSIMPPKLIPEWLHNVHWLQNSSGDRTPAVQRPQSLLTNLNNWRPVRYPVKFLISPKTINNKKTPSLSRETTDGCGISSAMSSNSASQPGDLSGGPLSSETGCLPRAQEPLLQQPPNQHLCSSLRSLLCIAFPKFKRTIGWWS